MLHGLHGHPSHKPGPRAREIPNDHAAFLAELAEDAAARLFRTGQRIAAALYSSGVRCEGVNLFLADGEAAGREVFHVHPHVLPRFGGDGIGPSFGPRYGKEPAREELDAVAQKVRSAL